MKIAVREGALALLVSVVIAVIPVAGFSSGQNPPPPPSLPGSDMIFDVRNGDQEGKLVLKDTELAFESLTDAKHSRNWKYADIRELGRSKKELRVRPFHGDKYVFQFKSKQTRDHIYDLIAQRILTARQGRK